MQVIAIITSIFLFSVGTLANANNCEAVKWPFSHHVQGIKPQDYEAVQREYLYRYLYYEISNPPAKRIPGLAKQLFYYLKNTEQNEDRYNMLGAFEYAADLDTPKPRVIPMKEICIFEDKIKREPSSSVQKAKDQKRKPQKNKK